MSEYLAIDLFSGCGGLSEGLKEAGFSVIAAFDNDPDAVATFKLNHPDTVVFSQDIREVSTEDIKKLLRGRKLHLLAGCPPCQGFSSLRRLNRRSSVRDIRNSLILEYLRFVNDLKPLTIMMENVPGLINYRLFRTVLRELTKLGYNPRVKVVKIEQYGVPQRRRRLVVVGSLIGELTPAEPTGETMSVADAIGKLESVAETEDPVHRIVTSHSPAVMKRILATPKNGGSRKDVSRFELKCHQRAEIGFHDIYGRLRWDGLSSTITGGCLNPSKGRFLHPEENRAITAREAAMLQTFRRDYQFPADITKTSISLLIGNALPPKFSRIQSEKILEHLKVTGS